ncbi:GAF domain-containing protein [Motilibacter rhizosphaerae]|uniref:GAF domain-containing protein n=1 Tax=Motilibacter rhizosphaerae TaxID=598652 RepID=UPI00102CDEB2|nr:GAF domain-containing protein [Motilibacter rhizosphaerae]
MDEVAAAASPERERALTVALIAVTAAAAGGGVLCGAFAGRASGAERAWLLAAGVLCAVTGVLATALQKRRDAARVETAQRVAEDAQVAFALTLNGALAPLTAYLGELAVAPTAEDRSLVTGRLAQAAVDAAVRVTTAAARSAFYRLDDQLEVLQRETWAGRPAPPRASFQSGTADGDYVLDLVHTGDIVLVDDVDANPLVTPSPRSGYRTVIAASVQAGATPLGLLTVDAPAVGDLTATDVEVVRVLAGLLAAGLAEALVRGEGM